MPSAAEAIALAERLQQDRSQAAALLPVAEQAAGNQVDQVRGEVGKMSRRHIAGSEPRALALCQSLHF